MTAIILLGVAVAAWVFLFVFYGRRARAFDERMESLVKETFEQAEKEIGTAVSEKANESVRVLAESRQKTSERYAEAAKMMDSTARELGALVQELEMEHVAERVARKVLKKTSRTEKYIKGYTMEMSSYSAMGIPSVGAPDVPGATEVPKPHVEWESASPRPTPMRGLISPELAETAGMYQRSKDGAFVVADRNRTESTDTE